MFNSLTGKSISSKNILDIKMLPLPRDNHYKDPYHHKLLGYALATWFIRMEVGSVVGALWVPVNL